MFDTHAAALVAVIALVTAGLRFLPFAIFRGREVPPFVAYLGKVLPFSIMGMLVVYCLRNVTFGDLSNWLPALISVALVVILHLWKRNTLLSIIGGTLCHMLLVQLIF